MEVLENVPGAQETPEVFKNEPMEVSGTILFLIFLEEEEGRKIAEREKRFGVIMAKPRADRN